MSVLNETIASWRKRIEIEHQHIKDNLAENEASEKVIRECHDLIQKYKSQGEG